MYVDVMYFVIGPAAASLLSPGSRCLSQNYVVFAHERVPNSWCSLYMGSYIFVLLLKIKACLFLACGQYLHKYRILLYLHLYVIMLNL